MDEVALIQRANEERKLHLCFLKDKYIKYN